MSPKSTRRTPKYRHYRPKNLAVVRIDQHDHYLGKYGSPESYERYHRLVAEWLGGADHVSAVEPTKGKPATTVNQLILSFWKHAQERYVKDGKPTSEIRSYRTALKPVRQLYGRVPVEHFGPLALLTCRQALIEAGICRKRINSHITRVRHMFKWGVARETVPETVWRALCAVEDLKYGEALETEPVKPVPEAHINAVIPFLSPQIAAMVNLQLWTACRPGEVCSIRTNDITMQGAVWEYTPLSHKTEHHGRQRVIYLGPHAQKAIIPWLKPDLEAFLFSPREACAWHREKRAKNRKTTLTPRKRELKKRPKRAPGECYNNIAYGHAIRRACARAGVLHWSPNRLRHNAGTRIRSEFGVEMARIILGHASAVTTEIYAEADREKAHRIMGEIG